MSALFPAALASLTVGGCDLPKDPRGTSAMAHQRAIRVGVSHSPPWVVLGPDGEPSGVEPALVRRFAAAQGARVQWSRGGEGELLDRLRQGRLDLVLAGLSERTPWKGRVGLTRPYARDTAARRVWAAPPGENGWLLRLDRFLADQRASLPALGVERP